MELPYISRSRMMIYGGAAAVLLLFAIVFFFGVHTPSRAPEFGANLEVWGVFQDKDTIDKFISAYHAAHPSVNLKYRNFEIETYEQSVVEALATGNGPDIFFINNTWLPRHLDKLVPAPPDLLTADEVRQYFVPAAADDFVVTTKNAQGKPVEQVFGAPLTIDTLALFYNKDIFNTAGLTGPPPTWKEFRGDVQRLTIQNDPRCTIRAGAAIGTARDAAGNDHVLRFSDILSLLMIQSGATMVSPDRTETKFATGGPAGAEALTFYTQFADPASPYYTWNRRLNHSVDAFYNQCAAMTFGYAYTADTIKRKAAYLNFGVAPAPQITVGEGEPKVNFTNYWAPVVTSKTLRATHEPYRKFGCVGRDDKRRVPASPCWYAWDFITGLLTPANHKQYLTVMQRPTALRQWFGCGESQNCRALDWQRSQADANLKVFIDEALTARNWYQPDSRAVEKYFAEAVDAVLLQNQTPEAALRDAAAKIDILFK